MGRHSTGSLPGGLARGRQKKGFKTAFGIEIVTEIEALLGTVVVDEWDLEAIETAARRMAMRVAARVVEQRLNADTSDHAGPMLPCACGQSARYAGRHGKNFESVLGPLRLERAYYHCAHYHQNNKRPYPSMFHSCPPPQEFNDRMETLDALLLTVAAMRLAPDRLRSWEILPHVAEAAWRQAPTRNSEQRVLPKGLEADEIRLPKQSLYQTENLFAFNTIGRPTIEGVGKAVKSVDTFHLTMSSPKY